MSVDLTKVLVRTGWPSGICPLHYGERTHYCNSACQPARIALAELQSDYDQYWSSLYGRDVTA